MSYSVILVVSLGKCSNVFSEDVKRQAIFSQSVIVFLFCIDFSICPIGPTCHIIDLANPYAFHVLGDVNFAY